MALIRDFDESFTVKRHAKDVNVCMGLLACPAHPGCSVPAPPWAQNMDCQSAVLCSRGKSGSGSDSLTRSIEKRCFKCGVINASVNCREEMMDFPFTD